MANRYFDLAYNAYERGELEKAIDFYSLSLRCNSKQAAAFYNRGIAKADLNKIEEAIADYEKAIRLDPDYSEALNNLGNQRYFAGDLESALSLYTASINAKPDNANPYLGRGLIAREACERQRAFADLERYIKLADNPIKGYTALANLYCVEELFERAIDACNKAMAIDENDALSYYNRAHAYRKLGDLHASLADYTRAIEIGSKYDARALTSRAIVYRSLGKDHLAEIDEKIAMSRGE